MVGAGRGDEGVDRLGADAYIDQGDVHGGGSLRAMSARQTRAATSLMWGSCKRCADRHDTAPGRWRGGAGSALPQFLQQSRQGGLFAFRREQRATCRTACLQFGEKARVGLRA